MVEDLLKLLSAHQIRVHLQFLGHPIANDSVYAETKIWVRACDACKQLLL